MNLPERLQALLNETGSTRGELADVLGCTRQRIDDLFCGRVAKIKKAEAERAAEQMQVSPQWLACGTGQMFLLAEEHEVLIRLQAIREATALVSEMYGLSDEERSVVQQIFVGLKMKSSKMVRSALSQHVIAQAGAESHGRSVKSTSAPVALRSRQRITSASKK